MQRIFLMIIVDVLMLGMCALWYSSVSRGDGTTIMRSYAKLTDEEKAKYDLNKVKRVQKDFIIIVAIAMLVFFSGMLWGSEQLTIIINGLLLLVIIILRYLIVETSFFLTLFCQKNG